MYRVSYPERDGPLNKLRIRQSRRSLVLGDRDKLDPREEKNSDVG